MLVHHGVGVDWFGPLLEEPALPDHYRLLSYHRVGYAGSSGVTSPLTFEQEAVHCRSLMRHLGIERTHVVGPALERYGAGDEAEAVDTFLRGVCGADYRAVLDRSLPQAFDQTLADADTFFGHELPAVQQWAFTQEDASRITQPALVVLGTESYPIFRERRELLISWLPNAEPFDLLDAAHLLHVQNPRGMAEGLAAFFAHHPISASP